MASAPTGLSRFFRSEATSAPPDSAPPPVDATVLAAVVKMVQLQLRQVPLDTLTAEVLPEMLRLYDAPAGALLLYRREDATLTLAAARGLAVAGAETLDVLRWGDERGFEMPLRALVDRKVYLVDQPEHDAFARQLVRIDGRRSLSSVAAVPLHRWHLPVGVLLVLGGDTPLGGDTLVAPSFAYDVLALALSNLLWARDERAAIPLPASDVAPPPLVCVPWVDLRRESDGELERLKNERDAAVAAARSDGGAALEAMVQELRAMVAGLETERQATAQERSALAERLAAIEQERSQLGTQLENAERDRELFASRLDSLEQEITRRLEAALQAQPPPTAASNAPPPPATTAPVRPPSPTVHAADPGAANPSAGSSPTPPPVTPPPAAAAPVERRVLESDPTLRDHIQTALGSAIPAGRGSVAVVNLLGCDAARLAEMKDAADAGMVVIGYAADETRASRILGPLRCFVAPPTASEASAAIESTARGNRRAILLSEDIDAFLAAKSALGKAGHSVSMACDEKQALDLLAILRPDTVLVDARGTGAPAVDFLDALGPESGRILTILVHGDETGATLARMATRMLRPTALDVNELVKVCRNALPEPKRAGAPTAAAGVRR